MKRGEAYFLASAFFSIFPEPLHLVQLLPALAASTQHGWSQVLDAAAAFTQQPAVLFSTASAAKAKPAVTKDRATSATNDFFI